MNSIVTLDKTETVDMFLEAIARIATDKPTDVEFEHDSTILVGQLIGVSIGLGDGIRLEVHVWEWDDEHRRNGDYKLEHNQLISLQDA